MLVNDVYFNWRIEEVLHMALVSGHGCLGHTTIDIESKHIILHWARST